MELLIIASILSVTTLAIPFPKDLQPISTAGPEDSCLFPSFQGLVSDNDTQHLGLDFQHMIRINRMLYIAARDHVFAVNLSASVNQIVPQQRLTWKSKDVAKCTVRGKNTDECYNYIKVLVPRNDETLFACGTNAFNPTCRNYRLSSLEQVGAELVGQARCPFESRQANVGIFASGHFYSATMSDFQASDAVIYRSLGGEGSPVLRSVKYDSKWLREPRFLHAIEYSSYVYFFFSEIAVEYTTLGKVVYSRVARVCKNDSGGSARVLERYWTSFLKARLNCSVPGDSFFYFDVLQSVSSIIQINQRPAVVGVFTTQMNSIPGSAVCGFYMDEIERVFQGRFKEQKGTDSAWSSVPEEQVPTPRPGSCAGDGSASAFSSSAQFPDSMLSFIKAHPLMDESVSSINDQPFLTQTTSSYKLTQIVVDTVAGPYNNRTVIFLGSEDGHVLKVLMSSDPNLSYSTTMLEDIHVYNPSSCTGDRRVLGLELDKEHHALFVAFSSCIIRVPLSRCAKHGNCKSRCLYSRDPYCIWLRTGSCADISPGFKAGFEQDIDGEQPQLSDICNDVISEEERPNSEIDSAFDVSGMSSVSEAESSSFSVHYTLLIACVLVAFVCGAFLSALMVSCYCGQMGHQITGSDPQAKLSLAKLSGLLEPQARRASEQIYCSFLSKPMQHGVASTNTALPGSSLDQQRSSLPTPDSTPELTIKHPQTKTIQSQWEQNQNCRNGPEVVPFTQSDNQSDSMTLSNNQSASLSFSINQSVSLSVSDNQSASPILSRSPVDWQCQGSTVDLDKFLKHLHQEVGGAPEEDRIAAVTSRLLPEATGPTHCAVSVGEASYYSSSTLPQDHKHPAEQMESVLQPEPETKTGRDEAVDQNPECLVRRPSQRLTLIKLGSGAAVSRQHSFNQRRAQQHRLVHISPKTNGQKSFDHSNRADKFDHADNANGLNQVNGAGGFDHGNRADVTDYRLLLPGGSCLTRQHSYSEQPHTQAHTHRAAIIRRTASLKPHPPKPVPYGVYPATTALRSTHNTCNY
ncbi:semaphorin-6C isoform X2 [Salminus brasiliensis]|uniref:semaphorin-6C isoform X2 n=1 Tax=Salminus brasiliensis TaxID=930266 RepID=UPI003B837FDF